MSDLSWMRLKLAELCGYEILHRYTGCAPHALDLVLPRGGFMSIGEWRPDEDVAQAIQCLESLNQGEEHEYFLIKSSTQCTNHWKCQLQFTDRTIESAPVMKPSYAICLAIAAAMGWESP